MPWPNKQQLLNAYPGLSSLDDPNNPTNQSSMDNLSRMLAATPTAEQPAQTQPQAMAGNSQNAEQPPQIDLQQQYMQMMLGQTAISPEMQKQIQDNIEEQKRGIGEFKNYQDALRKSPIQTDLSPTMALADYVTGTDHFGKNYQKPQSGEDRISALAKLQGMSQDERNKITQDLVKLATGKNAQGQLRALSQQANLDFRQRATAQKQYDSGVAPIKQSLDASSRFNSLLKEATEKDGSIKATPQLLRTLAIEQAKLVSGKGNFGEGSTEGLMVDSYAAKTGGLLQKIQNAPQGVLSPEFAKQLKNESDILARDYQTQVDSLADQLRAGATPTQLQVLNQRHRALQDTYKKRFGYWGQNKESQPQYEQTASNPDTGERVGLINGQWVPIK